MRVAALATALALCAATGASAFTLAGDTVDAGVYFTVDTGYGIGRINGFGLDAPFVVVDGAADVRQYSESFRLDVDGGGFLVDFLGQFPTGWQDGVVLRLMDLDFSPSPSFLTGVGVDTNLAGYTLAFGADYIEIGLGGTSFTDETYFRGTFAVSGVPAIPEPSTIVLTATGMLAVASVARRSRARHASRGRR